MALEPGTASEAARKTRFNERVKLFAATLDRLTTIFVSVGFVAPGVNVVLHWDSVSLSGAVSAQGALTLLYIGAGVVLHVGAQVMLGLLRS